MPARRSILVLFEKVCPVGVIIAAKRLTHTSDLRQGHFPWNGILQEDGGGVRQRGTISSTSHHVRSVFDCLYLHGMFMGNSTSSFF